MLEQEIKLHVPAAARRAVVAALDSGSRAGRIRLRALYFDTPDRQLARQRAAIRLRLEGRRWVQTFKMSGSDALSRVELNHPRPGPELDLSVYEGTPAQDVIANLRDELAVRYETDVRRILRRVRLRTGTVELAYDVGHIRASALEMPLNELEIEHVSGRLDALFTCADRWLRQHSLVLDLRSKAERGDRLADAAKAVADAPLAKQTEVRAEALSVFGKPRRQQRVSLSRDMTPAQALDAITIECLEQVARNAVLATGLDTPPNSSADIEVDAVHQLRVGLRRLRSAWRLFDGWTPLPEGTLQDGARELFGAMGVARDRDVLAGSVMPQLVEAGMPPLHADEDTDLPVAAMAGGTALQRWLLCMHAWAAGVRAAPFAEPVADAGEGDATEPPEQPALKALVRRRLRKWHRKVLADALRIGELEDEDRHQVRKRAKRLRYGIDLTADLLGKQARPYRKRLADLQDVMGEINDLAVARDTLRERLETEPQAWFGLGWISQRMDTLVAQAQQRAKALRKANSFWK